MRLPAAFLPGPVPVTALVLALLAPLLGCVPGDPVRPHGVRRLTILIEADTLRPGRSIVANAVATGVNGEIVDAPITWRSMTPATLAVAANGEVFAVAPGIGTVRATVGGVIAERSLQLVNPPAVAIVAEPESLTLTLPGASVVPQLRAIDAFGDELVGAPLLWRSDAARIASVSAGGDVQPVAVGRTTIRVSLDGIERELPVAVTPLGGPNAPRVDSVVPRTLGIGVPFTVYGQRLGAGAIAVDGFGAQVLTPGSTQITAMLPSLADACVPSGDAAVQVTTVDGVGAGGVRIQLAPRRALAVGEAALLLSAADASCVELPADGRYVLTLLHTGRAVGAGSIAASLEMRSGREAAPTLLFASAPNALRIGTVASNPHLDVLERARQYAPAAVRMGDADLRVTAARVAALQVPPAGGIASVRVPDLDDPRLCVGFRAIGARTVYDGARIAILEDTATALGGIPALAGQMDAAIAALGSEVEGVIWPLIERFGNPLVMDDRLDANGKVVLVLTPTLNHMRGGGVMGAVVTCDFFPRGAAPSSNVGETLYLQVPDLLAHPDPDDAIRVWRGVVRGTIAHELKHVVGFAERIARGQPLEESWLEEATARHAEELYTRALTGLGATADADYAPLRCEALALLGDGGCLDTPTMLRPALAGLYRFLDAPQSHSPLGSVAPGDDSYYGSAWSLLRWAMDHAAIDEESFTRALSTSGQSGLANLEARAGRNWDEMLARWSLATITDGRGSLEASDPLLRFRGWQLGALFEGFCGDLGGCGGGGAVHGPFGRAHPARLTPLAGDVRVSVPEIVAGGFAAFELAPALAGSTRLLRLRGLNDAPPPSSARLALLRVE